MLRKESTSVSPPGRPAPTAPPGSKFTSLFRRLTSRFSRSKKHIPATAQHKLARTYEFVDPSRLRVSPSPKPRFGYINGSPRSSYAPPSPSWLSRHVSQYPRARHRPYSFAIHSTFLPPDLAGTLPRHPPISHIGPLAISTPRSPQLASLPPSLPTQQSSAASRPLTIHHYRPPTPPKGRGKQHTRTPFLLPQESIIGDLTSKKPTRHERSNSTLSDTNFSATVS